MTILLPADELKREEENFQIKKFGALSEEERKNQTVRFQLEYAAQNGLFKVQPNLRAERSYRVIYDFDPNLMLAVCMKTIAKVDPELIIKEDQKRGPTAR